MTLILRLASMPVFSMLPLLVAMVLNPVAAEAAAAGLSKKNADGSLSAFAAGDIRFRDLNGDKLIDESDRQVIGDPNPDFTGGFSNSIAFHRFKLDALFTFSSGNDVYNYLRNKLESLSGVENQLQSAVRRWRADGQQTEYEAFKKNVGGE